ncbi:MAG: nicotinate-nucleotide adenylyltransferase [bacterium]|nr:nicotinate-nucleotide adenylyltransferase [bacterium]
MKRRIGILGGTFDPIHLGHLIVAQEVLLQGRLDQMLFMPSGDPPHKQYPEMASAQARAEMVGLAVGNSPHFDVLRFELDRPGKSYTVETLRHLQAQWGNAVKLFLVIGTDNAVDMSTWFDPEGVLALAQVLVAERPGFDRSLVDPTLGKKMQFLETPLLEISSTDIRRRVRERRPIEFLVPDAVIRYIEEKGLYR